jgi:tetratricopeptide (TPR) repeat protein
MQQAQYSEVAEATQILADHGCDPRVSLIHAAALEAIGDKPGAEASLKQANSLWPNNSSIAASLARLYMADGDKDAAAAALTHFKPASTTPPQELELAAVVYLAVHQLKPARAAAEILYAAHPSVHSLLLLANTMQLQGRFKDVVHLLDSQRSQYSESPEFLVTLAESEYDSILYDTAKDDLQHAITLNPNLYQAHYLLGNVMAKLNDPDKAISEYKQAIALAPNQPRTYYQLALLLEEQHDGPGEESMLRKALTADANYAPAHVELGRLLLAQGSVPEAVSQLNQAIQNNPSTEQAYFLLARAYAQLGEKDKSDEMAKRLVEVRNANWRASNSGDGSQQHPGQTANP